MRPSCYAPAATGGLRMVSADDPTAVLRRSRDYFIQPEKEYEITGQVGNVCFLEGLVHFEHRWLLYYGTVDSSQQITQILPMDEINDAPHQVYIYDDKTNKVVAVRTLDAKHHDFNFPWEPLHKYRVYFY